MDSEKYAQNRKKALVISIALFIILSLITIFAAINSSLKSTTVQILVAPTSAKVKLDGKTYSSSKTLKTYPKDGDFTATVYADGFITQEVSIQLQKDNVSYIYIVLDNKEEGIDWYSHQGEAETDRLQEIADCISSMDVQDYVQKYPIAQILPYVKTENNKTTYRIDYGQYENCQSDFCLKITDNAGDNENNALNYIKKHGFNPDDYEIAYENTAQNIKNNPITNYLPYSNLYTIDYTYGMNNELVLSVNSPQTYYNDAINKLKNFVTAAQTIGDNKTIAEYNIQFLYQDFTNPFSTFADNKSSDPIEYLKNGFRNIDSSQNVQVQNGSTEGEYYYTILTIGEYSSFSQVTFRAILIKSGNSWRLASTPQPILTKFNTENVPISILNKANN